MQLIVGYRLPHRCGIETTTNRITISFFTDGFGDIGTEEWDSRDVLSRENGLFWIAIV